MKSCSFFLAVLWLSLVAPTLTNAAEPIATRAFLVDQRNALFSDVSDRVEVSFSAMRWNRSRNLWQCEVSLRNSSNEAIPGALLLAVTESSGTPGPRNTDNDPSTVSTEPPYWNLTAQRDGPTLGPAQSTRSRSIFLGRQGDEPPRLVTRVYAESASSSEIALALTRTLDAMGHPLPGTLIEETGPSGPRKLITEAGAGFVTLGTQPGDYRWQFSAEDFLPAWRQATLRSGSQSIPFPRLTPRSSLPFPIGPNASATDLTEDLRVEIRAGTSTSPGSGLAHPIDPQSPPFPLPIGWNPQSLFALEWEASLALPLRILARPRDPVPPGRPLAIARLDTDSLTWRVVLATQVPSTDRWNFETTRPGVYAVVVADPAPTTPPAPVLDQPLLPSSSPVPPLSELSVTGRVVPPVSLASTNPLEVTAEARLSVEHPGMSLPSGTILAVTISERYRLSNGSSQQPPDYQSFITLFRRPDETQVTRSEAQFPLQPIRLFPNTDLTEAVLEAKVIPPAASVGYFVAETTAPVTWETFSFRAQPGSLPSPRFLQVTSLSRESIRDIGNGMLRLASSFTSDAGIPTQPALLTTFEVTAGFSSPTEQVALDLIPPPAPGYYVLARAWYSGPQAGLEPVAQYRVENGRWLQPDSPLNALRSGIDRSGQYALCSIPAPLGSVTGTVRNANGAPLAGQAVTLKDQPWSVISGTNGSFQILAPLGPGALRFQSPSSGSIVERSFVLPDSLNLAGADLTDAGAPPFIIAFSPVPDSTNVPLLAPIEVRFSQPVQHNATAAAVELSDGRSVVIPSRTEFSPDSRSVRLIPSEPLTEGTEFRIRVSSEITDTAGRRLSGSLESRFTTIPPTARRVVGAQLFSAPPDAQGLTRIVGSAGMAPPRHPVLFVNDTTGQTTTLLSNADGSFTNAIPAALTDRLRIVLANADGTRSEIPVGRQIFPDGSVALYSEGGRITNRNEGITVVLDVPPGAVLGRTRFRIEPLHPADIPSLISNAPPENSQVFGALDLVVDGDPVQGKLRVEVRVDRSAIQTPPGKSLEDLALFASALRELDDAGEGSATQTPVYQYQSLLKPLPSTASSQASTHALFAAMYAAIDPVGARIMLVGSVYYSQTEVFGHTASALFVGGRDVIEGTQARVGGAVVRARARSQLNPRPFSLQGGELIAISEANGSFAFLVPEQGISGGHALIATHPAFPRQFATGAAVRVDPLYPNAASSVLFDRGRTPDNVPPSISVSHVPALPPAGSDAIVRVEATDESGPATVSVTVEQVDPATAVASAVQRNPGVWDVRSSSRSKVVLRVRAVDGAGLSADQIHVILFGEPPVPPRPANDPSGPFVVYSDPDDLSRGISTLLPVTLHFNEWIDTQVIQAPSTYFTLTPNARSLSSTYGEDPKTVVLSLGGLQDDTEYTLTVQGLRDFSGQVFDQNPDTNSPPAEPYQLRFRTAPILRSSLSNIGEGGGAALLGSFAYVIDRSGFAVNRYDLTVPTQPRLTGQRTLPGPPRAITLVTNYEFTLEFDAPDTPSDRPGPLQRTDLLIVAGKTAGAQFGYLRVFDLRSESFEATPAIGVANLSLDETAVFGRLVWSAPNLLLIENSLAAPQVHVLNLQTVLLGDAYRQLTEDALRNLPLASTPGLDANSDGDFVDANDKLPTVGRDAINFVAGQIDLLSLNPNRPGPNGLYQLQETSRFITDAAFHGPSGQAAILTTPGRDTLVQIRGYPIETNQIYRPTTVRSFVIGQSSPDTLVPTVISNAFGLEFEGWYPKRGLFLDLDFQRLLLLNLVSLDYQSNSLRVIDASRPDALFELTEIPFPASEYGLLQGAEIDPLGRVVLSTASLASAQNPFEDLVLLDPAKLLLPQPRSGPHPSILGRVGGLGTGVTPFAFSPQGVSVGSLRSRNWVGQGPPSIRFLPAGTNTFEAVQQLDPEERLAQLRILPDPEELPVAGQSTNATLRPDSPPFVWYLLAEAPGGAGNEIRLAVLSLDSQNQPTPGTNVLLTSVAPDVVLRRLAPDPHLNSFNAYLSEPLVLMPDAASESDIRRFAGQLRMIRAGSRIRVGIPESMASNPVIGPFAGIGMPQVSPPPNAPPVRLGASQSRPVSVISPTLSVDDPISIRTTVDRLNGRSCPGSDWLNFEHSLDAEISILIDGRPLRNVYDENGNLVVEFTNVPSVAGHHRLLLDAAHAPEPGDHTVEVRASRFSGLDPSRSLRTQVTLQHEIEINQTFPIGHTIIQGVDLWDGHLGHSGQDAHVPGRKQSLTFSRTYSSAGDSSDGPLGAGWSHSYNIRLVHRLACGVFTVIGGEGSGNAFTDPNPNPNLAARYLPLLPNGLDPANLDFFKPQIGYHSVLVRDRTQPSQLWFFTKEALRHDFVAEGALSNSSQQVFTLRAIREPNGNALTFDYLDGDTNPATLDSVTERDALGQLPKRAFHFDYDSIAGEQRITTLRGFNHQGSRDLLGLEVRYAYDSSGNLTNVTRLGPTPETTRVEQFRYTQGTGPDGHNLIEYTGPNGAITRYAYAATTSSSGNYYTSNGALLPGLPAHEIVTNVTHVGSARPGFEATANQAYGFRFDFPNFRRFVSEARAMDSDGNPIPETEYTLNLYGATLRIRAPLGQETEMRWATDHLDGSVLNESGLPTHDALMTWRRDPEGQEQFFEFHDGRGNLTRERTVLTGSSKRPVTDATGNPVSEIVQRHAYDSVFNQTTNTVDAEGNATVLEIDPRTGNLLRILDAEGYATRFAYRPDGDLQSRTDPRGFTTEFLDYDPYGNPTRIRDALGNETITTYDERGRATEMRDSFKHHTRTVYDSLDRKVVEMRLNDLSGLFNPSAISSNRFDAAGLLLESVNPLGLVTRPFYDALNRPIRSVQSNIRQADGSLVSYETAVSYDAAGNMISETDGRGIIRRHAYDALGRRIRTTIEGPFTGPSNGSGILARLAYDRAGNLTNEIDLHGLATSHVHDALYRIVESRLPFPGSVHTTRYDREGNKTRATDADGFATTFEYDRIYRLRRTTNPEGHVVEMAYDANGNRTNFVDRVTGLITQSRFDAANRETEHSVFGPGLPPSGYTTVTTYQDDRNQVTTTNARGVSSRFRKDGLDRLAESIVDPGGLDLITRQTHDPSGNILTTSDPEGADIDQTQEFDALGRRIRVTYVRTPDDTGDVTETFSYDPSGNLIATTDRRGFARRTRYDNLGRPFQIEALEPISNNGAWRTLLSTDYDDTNRRITQTDARGQRSVSEKDELGRVTRTTDALGFSTLTTHGRVDVLSETDAKNQRTAYSYDRLHRLLSQTDFDTNGTLYASASIAYRDTQRRIETIDRRGLVSIAEMDALGRTVRLERSAPDLAARYGSNPVLLEQRQYDGNGNWIRQIDANGTVTEFAYDAADRLTNVVVAAGTPAAASTSTHYDRVGNVLSVKDGRSHGGSHDILHSYDARYRRIATENALAQTTRFRFDAANNLIELTDPRGDSTRYEYDEGGALLAVDETPRLTSADAGMTRFRYDPNGNLIAQQDANGNLVTREYDALNRVTNLLHHTLPGTLGTTIRRSGPFGGGNPLAWAYAYDANGNRTRVVDPRGQSSEQVYDPLDRVALHRYTRHAETNANGSPLPFQPLSFRYVYDGNNNPIEILEEKQGLSSPFSERTTFDYDGLDRLISTRRLDHDDPTGRMLQFGYDLVGNRTNLVDADGRITASSFDAQHRLVSVALDPDRPAPLQTVFTWEPDGLLRSVDLPGGTRIFRTYDAADRLIALTNAAPSPLPPHSVFNYTYDANGNRTAQSESQSGSALGSESTFYQYDRLNRLTSVQYGLAGTLTHTYAPNGNRLSERGIDPVTGAAVHRTYRYDQVPGRNTTTFSGVNALTRIEDVLNPSLTIDYDYDASLNQIARTQGADRRTFRYDVRDQLIEATHATQIVRFDYNADRLRVKKVPSFNPETRYLYDQSSVVLEYGPAAAGHASVRKYDYGVSLLAISTTSATSTLDRAFYLLDGLHNTVGLVDPSGALEDQYRFDAWGRIRGRVGTNDNPRLFTGHYKDPETGLHYFGARYYDDEQARFITADPNLGEPESPPSLHRYLYANANPLRFSDPTGFESESGDPSDRWIAETRSMLKEMDQRMEDDIAAEGPGALDAYREGQKAAEELQRMGEERQRMLQEAGLTEADLRNPVPADRAKWGLALLKRDLEKWSAEGDAGLGRAIVAGIAYGTAQFLMFPLELGSASGTVAGKLDVGAEVTAGEWVAAISEPIAALSTVARGAKIGRTLLSKQAAVTVPSQGSRGAVIAEARRTIGREAADAAKRLDDVPKRIAADREWYQINRVIEESSREASLLRRAETRLKGAKPFSYIEDVGDGAEPIFGRLPNQNLIDQKLADLYVHQMLRQHSKSLVRVDELTRQIVSNAGKQGFDDTLRALSKESPFEIRRAKDLPSDIPGYHIKPRRPGGNPRYNPVRYSPSEDKLFVDVDLIDAARRGSKQAASKFAGEFLHDSAAIPLLRRYGKANTPVVVFDNIIQVPTVGFRPRGMHMTHYFDEALNRYLRAYRALHPATP